MRAPSKRTRPFSALLSPRPSEKSLEDFLSAVAERSEELARAIIAEGRG
jgi:hypothetical protein